MNTRLALCHSGRNGKAEASVREVGWPKIDLRRIMVPVDLSGCSMKAFRYAVSLARDYNADVIVLNVLQQAFPSEAPNQRKRQLDALIRKEAVGFDRASAMVQVGDPLREIVHAAKTENVDLLVISTHARGYLPDFCLGSAAEQIVRYAPCPVLVVRDAERDFVCAQPPIPGSSRDRKHLK